MTAERIHCCRCAMSFRVELPSTRVTWTRCAEPGCGRLFWHGRKVIDGRDRVVCGIDPTEHRSPPSGERGLPAAPALPVAGSHCLPELPPAPRTSEHTIDQEPAAFSRGG